MNMRRICQVGVTLWLVAIAVGFAWLARYETRAGRPAQPPWSWPDDSRLVIDRQRWTAVMFVHPRCPCSKASLQELSDLVTNHGSVLHGFLVVCKPIGVPVVWENADILQESSAINGVAVYCDENDEERGRFAVHTSGQVLLYNPRGKLCYTGGITAARGKVGESQGHRFIESILLGEDSLFRDGPVFGCPLVEAD